MIDFVPSGKVETGIENPFLNKIMVQEDVLFDLKETLKYTKKYVNIQERNIILGSDREFRATEKGQLWGHEVEEVIHFFWKSSTNILYFKALEKFTPELLKYWTLHLVLPIFFTIEETYNFLHAGAVEVAGKPILFVAESFGGKSTMTDFFIKQGHAMITDDKLACHEEKDQFFVLPSYPYHRPYRQLEDLGYFVENMATISKPIHAIYELDKAEPNTPIAITELHGIEKFKVLRYSSEFNLTFLKTKQFAFLSRLAKAVPVYKVTVPWDMERLPEVYETIVNHSNR